ncbi:MULTISPECIES: ABC transporter substrate-binding protein [unclassified Frigoribacterium]|uniref:ABC transporter substrate-binding protein n=1 Tax=unclassified Frigoribacterium TaxID=2627005 RepID=UPI0006FA51C1|nr:MULTISPECIES: ABC transporter substrate-binding protein [unclassified Frigoribacterium]KQO46877.1 glycine/betaine ABC transporter [Frigoribacterium sp. Leaf254]KQT38970.1 glycine/betaine ABC transporter [Frigoribacterium sp. Leaf415]
MITANKKGRLTVLGAVAIGAMVALAGCASSDPLSSGDSSASGDGDTLVIGSQQYYSNEIIAELYAQALEAKGYKVDRQYQIGQREVYLPELESGKIDVFPEYTGNLLQYYDKEETAKSPEEVETALAAALPDGLTALKAAAASDQDSYNVTKEFSEENDITSLADLKNYSGTLTLGAPPENAERPYGPPGLKSIYGVDVTSTPIDDGGGPLTVKALTDGSVQLADIYTASPLIAENDLVTLEDPENMILPQNVVPIVSDKVDSDAQAVIDGVDAVLSASDLQELNSKSQTDKESSATIAKDYLTEKGLLDS